ncbi:MAG: PKD domain-containing protein [Terracidiphilus sp.]
MIDQPAHSVRMLKLIDTSAAPAALDFEVQVPADAQSGKALDLWAASKGEVPLLEYRWDFGDGVSAEGAKVTHTYTQPGKYAVTIAVKGLDQRTSKKVLTTVITGYMPTAYNPAAKDRYRGNDSCKPSSANEGCSRNDGRRSHPKKSTNAAPLGGTAPRE